LLLLLLLLLLWWWWWLLLWLLLLLLLWRDFDGLWPRNWLLGRFRGPGCRGSLHGA
jgi:hypothetical protein